MSPRTRPAAALALLFTLPTLLACIRRDDDYFLVRRDAPRADRAPTRFHFARSDDPEAALVRYQLGDGFGGELLRTLAMTKRFVARTSGDARARAPIYVALGPSDVRPGASPAAAYRRRVLAAAWFEQTIPDDTPIVWTEGPSATDASVLSELATGIGAAIVDLVAPGATHRERPPLEGPAEVAYPLRDGYAMFLNVVAAEWHPPGGGDPRAELRRGGLFSEIRSGEPVQGPRLTPDRMVRDPRVIATVLYRMAASDLSHRLAPDDVYRPFLEAAPPRGISPALLLGAFRNFQAKLLAAWGVAVAAGHKPIDVVDLVEAYADAYPRERAEVTRIFLVTTYGATALPEAIRAQDAPEAVASELAGLTADVLFGRRGLRDGLGRLPPAHLGRL